MFLRHSGDWILYQIIKPCDLLVKILDDCTACQHLWIILKLDYIVLMKCLIKCVTVVSPVKIFDILSCPWRFLMSATEKDLILKGPQAVHSQRKRVYLFIYLPKRYFINKQIIFVSDLLPSLMDG